MRLFSTVAVLAIFWSLVAQEPGPSAIEGRWVGQWVRDGDKLEVSMRFSRDRSGYTGSFSSDQLRVIDIPMQKIQYESPRVSWQVVGDFTTTTFDGELRNEEISGKFRDGDAEGTFAFTRSVSQETQSRKVNVTFQSGDITLAGTVVLPEGNGRRPGIVFLHGSGAEGRWASNFLATKFADRGIASLVYDKRGVGESRGDWRKASFADLVEDAVAAVAALRSRPEVDASRVGVQGHSQGGTLVPWVASRVKDLAFVVASAPSGLPMDELEVFSLDNTLGVAEMGAADAQLAREYVRAIVGAAYRGKPRADLEAVWKKVEGKPWAFAPPAEADFYWEFSRKIGTFDSIPYWQQVTAPALLVFGESDQLVPARRSAARIAEAYLSGQGNRLHTEFFKGADHGFRVTTKRGERFAWPRSAPGYPNAVVDWVSRVTLPQVNR